MLFNGSFVKSGLTWKQVCGPFVLSKPWELPGHRGTVEGMPVPTLSPVHTQKKRSPREEGLGRLRTEEQVLCGTPDPWGSWGAVWCLPPGARTQSQAREACGLLTALSCRSGGGRRELRPFPPGSWQDP